MNDYNTIHYALDFAVKTEATSVTIDIDEGVFTMPPSEAVDYFSELAPGEAFVLHAITYNEDEEN